MSRVPLVSIVIPCYNAEVMISRCLNSCFQQTYPNIEIIVVDNNSTDNSTDVVRHLANTVPHRFVVTNCYQQGPNSARNHGFSFTKGDYIQWLDADDELAPTKIAWQVSALEKNRNYEIAYGDWSWRFYDSGRISSELVFTSQEYDDYLLQLLADNWQPPHAYLLRRTAATKLDEISGWHKKTRIATDREYFTLAAVLGFRFLYVPQVFAYYNNWSANQLAQSTSYLERARNLRSIFLRLQDQAQQQLSGRITERHWFALRQNWHLWILVPNSVSIIRQKQQHFLVRNNPMPVMISVSLAEAMVLSAMQKYSGAHTLEHHARVIVRILIKYIVQHNSLDLPAAIKELERLVGLTTLTQAERQPQTASALKVQEKLPETASMTATSSVAASSLQVFIDRAPLYAPIFGEQRLKIVYILERLCARGLLMLAVRTDN